VWVSRPISIAKFVSASPWMNPGVSLGSFDDLSRLCSGTTRYQAVPATASDAIVEFHSSTGGPARGHGFLVWSSARAPAPRRVGDRRGATRTQTVASKLDIAGNCTMTPGRRPAILNTRSAHFCSHYKALWRFGGNSSVIQPRGPLPILRMIFHLMGRRNSVNLTLII
jgi:hypothetical protein